MHKENSIPNNISKDAYGYIIKNSDLNVFFDNKSLLESIINDTMFLNRIGESNQNYLIEQYKKLNNKTTESDVNKELKDKVVILENKVDELIKLNKIMLEKFDELSTKNNKRIV